MNEDPRSVAHRQYVDALEWAKWENSLSNSLSKYHLDESSSSNEDE